MPSLRRGAVAAGASALLRLTLCAGPAAVAAPAAAEVDKRADALLARMTLEEKIDYIGGADSFYVRAIPRLGLPAFRLADGPFGVRNVGPSTAYPAGIGLAATWDPTLAHAVGAAIGRDARARGVHVMLAPGVNIYRAPMCGRNFEYLGEDPFLAARMAVGYIEGLQEQGVSATVKHFLGNNSEVDRHHTSSDIDPRALREIYLPAFEAAVKEAHVGAVMTSYNLVNGLHMSENGDLVNGLLKKEWGFDGLVMSDWDATYDGVAAATAGLDLEMPSAKLMTRETLLAAIGAGKLSAATLDDKVRRILRTAIRFGWLDRPAADLSAPLYDEAGRATALDAARAGMVLLKNDKGFLPLDRAKIKTIALIGPGAYPAIPVGGGSAQVRPLAAVSFVQGLADHLRGAATVLVHHGVPTLAEIFDATDWVTAPTGGQPGLRGEYFDGPAPDGAPALTRVDAHIDFAWDKPNFWPTGDRKQSSARWTGAYVAPDAGEYIFAAFTYGLDEYRLYVDGKLVLDRARGHQPIGTARLRLAAGRAYAIRFEYQHGDHHARVGLGVHRADTLVDPAAVAIAKRADAVVVAAGFDPMTESEGYDRTFGLPLGQDDLIAAVRAANPRVAVAITSGGGVDMTRFVDRVPAILQTWYPGQEGGTALAEILFGDVNPSGKLPVTFERRFEDSAVHVYDSYYPDAGKQILYKEGVFLGYRHFDQAKKQPLFPFGHGLSYTRFKYANLSVEPAKLEGDTPVTLSFDVTNVGTRRGAEVAQVYLGERKPAVPRPPKELKGFSRVDLNPGETRRVQIALDRRAFSFYDLAARSWRAQPGTFDVLVGASSRKIELSGTVSVR